MTLNSRSRTSRRPNSARLFIGAVALALLTTACSSSSYSPAAPNNPPPPTQTALVTLGASSFSPASVSVFPGGTVTWNNSSGVTHNVTFSSASAPANIPNHSTGSSARDFPTAGTFNYQCTLHSGMTGRVTVVP